MTRQEIKDFTLYTLKKTKGRYPDILISGFTYNATVDAEGNTVKIDLKDKNGKPLDMKKTDSVGMNSYIYSKYEFKHADPGVSLKITSAQALIDYIKQKQTISGYEDINRITITQQ